MHSVTMHPANAQAAPHAAAQCVWMPRTMRLVCRRAGGTREYAVRISLRELGRGIEFLDAQIERLDDLIVPLVNARAPGPLSLYGVGPDTAPLLLIAAGDHPERLRSEGPGRTCAPWARSRAPRGRPAGTGSTATGTARPITPCGASSSPG